MDTNLINKVLDLEGVKSFCMSDCDVFFSDPNIRGLIFSNPVPVLDTSGNRLGFAVVYEDSGVEMATMYITRECPERLDLESRTRSYHLVASTRTTIDSSVPSKMVPFVNIDHLVLTPGEKRYVKY
jgi:hypothetical protein